MVSADSAFAPAPTGSRTPDGSGARGHRRNAALFVAIVVVAFGARLIHLYEFARLPTFQVPIGDARAYIDWSRRIVEGDWIGREVFYQAPLYPYFLAVTQLITGPDPWRIRLVQIGLGSLACGLLFLANRRFFSRGAGVLAGLIAALYPPAIFFDALIQKTVLDTFFMCLLLWILARLSDRPARACAMALGAVVGCFALTRENVLLFVPIIALWLLTLRTQPMARRMVRLVLFALGMSAVLVPVGLRNKHIGGAFLITTAQFGPNFFIGNNERATGLYVPLRPGREEPTYERTDATELAQQAMGRSLSPAEVSEYWSARAWDWIRSHPGAWLRLLGVKCMRLVNSHEIADAEDFHFYQLKCPLIRRLGVVLHFGVVAPLALAGLVLTWNRRRELWILHALLLALALGVVLFIIYSRYRFPMVPILVLFTAAGVVEAVRTARRSGLWTLAPAAVAACIAALVVNRSLPDSNPDSARNHSNLAVAYLQSGHVDAAVEELHQALRLDSKLAFTNINLADAYWRQGRASDSIQALRKALELLPGDEEVELALGTAFAHTGQFAEAERHLRAGLVLAPKRPQVINDFAVVLSRLGKWDEALEALRRGARESPDDQSVLAHLAWNLATCPMAEYRNGPEAVQLAEMCCRKTELKDAGVLDVLAAAYAESGQFDKAVAAEQRALRLIASAPAGEKTRELRARLQLYQAQRPYRQP